MCENCLYAQQSSFVSLALLWFIFNLSHHLDATTRSKELTLNTTLWTKLQASFTTHQLYGKCPLPVPKSCPGALDYSELFILPRWLLTDFLSPHPLQSWHFSKGIYSPVTVVECRLIYMVLNVLSWLGWGKARLPQRDNVSLLMASEPGMHTPYVSCYWLC